VTPGFVATEMLDGVPEKVLDRIKGQIPVGRLCQPEEIARVSTSWPPTVVVHHRAGLGRQRRTGHVTGVPAAQGSA